MNIKPMLTGILFTLLLCSCGSENVKKESYNNRIENTKQVDDKSTEMIYLKLGIGYLQRGKQGDLDVALEKFKKSISVNPKFALAHSMIATVYDQKSLFDSAEKHYKLSIKYNNNNPDVLNNYANFLCQRGSYDLAVENYLIIVNNPQYKTPGAAYENAGVCSYKANNLKKAEEYFRSALDLNQSKPNSLYYLLLINQKNKNFQKARAFLQRLEQLVKPSAEILAAGYEIENKLGNKSTAKIYLNKLKSQFPDSEILKNNK